MSKIDKQQYVSLDVHKTPSAPWEKFKQVSLRSIKLELLKGLQITIGVFRRTVWGNENHNFEYPLEKYEMSPRYRAVHKLNIMLESGNDRCIGCGLCEKICISDCIRIDSYLDENNRKAISGYSINYGRCIFCGYCAEVCPELAIVHGDDYENSSEQRAHFTVLEDLTTPIDNLINQKEYAGFGAVSPDADAKIKKTPLAY